MKKTIYKTDAEARLRKERAERFNNLSPKGRAWRLRQAELRAKGRPRKILS